MQKIKANSLKPGQKVIMDTTIYKVSSISGKKQKGKKDMVLLNIESIGGAHSSKRRTLVIDPGAYVYIKN